MNVHINWKGLARFLGLENKTIEELKAIRMPPDHLEIEARQLRKYTPPTVRPTPHNPEECHFCKQMVEDDLAKGLKE